MPALPAPVPPLGSQAAPLRWQPWGWRSAAAPKQAMGGAIFFRNGGFEAQKEGDFTYLITKDTSKMGISVVSTVLGRDVRLLIIVFSNTE